jgi:hypothetical protein
MNRQSKNCSKGTNGIPGRPICLRSLETDDRRTHYTNGAWKPAVPPKRRKVAIQNPHRCPPSLFHLTGNTVRGDVIPGKSFGKYMVPHVGPAYRRQPEFIVLPGTQGGVETASIQQKLPAGDNR